MRIYVLRGIDLQPKDSNGLVSIQRTRLCINESLSIVEISWLVVLCIYTTVLFQCDPYLKITLGKKTIDDRDHYNPNTLNPEFGRLDVVKTKAC